MKQPIPDDIVINYLDFLVRMRPFEGTSTIDGKTEFILFWAIYARIPLPEALTECYWISARWIPKESMDEFLSVLRSTPKRYDSVSYPDWTHYQKDMPASYIYKTYNEMLEKSVLIRNMYNQIQRVIDFTIDYLNERFGYVVDGNNIKRYFQMYFDSELFLATLQEINIKSREKKGKIEKKKDRKY